MPSRCSSMLTPTEKKEPTDPAVTVTWPNDAGVPPHQRRRSTNAAADFIQPPAYFFLISGVQKS
jgi:hypothetical protein